MEINIERKTLEKKHTLLIILGVLLTSLFIVFLLLNHINFIQLKQFKSDSKPLQNSIAIYVIADSGTNELYPDLRTKFWEPQLSHQKNNITVHYVSDGEISIGNKEWIIPPTCTGENSDPGLCERNVESWFHFVNQHPDVSWYFKANQDTYINVDALLQHVSNLEQTINPMKEPFFQFALEETDNIIHPSGNSGWLISNAAIKILDTNSHHFIAGCSETQDNIALGMMISDMQYDVDKFESPFFIPIWPEGIRNIANPEWSFANTLKKCPLSQFRFNDKIESPFQDPYRFIATRMAFTPMNEVPIILKKIPSNFRIYYPSEENPIFCSKDV